MSQLENKLIGLGNGFAVDLKEGVYDDPEVWGLGSWAYFWKMGLFPETEYGTRDGNLGGGRR